MKSVLDQWISVPFWQRLETFLFQNQILSPIAPPKEVNLVLSHPKTGGNSLHASVAAARKDIGQTMHSHYTKAYSANYSTKAMSSRLEGQFSNKSLEDLKNLYLHSEFNAKLAEFAAHWLKAHLFLPLQKQFHDSVYEKERRPDLPRTNIIISVREPVACCLSGYFQIMHDTSVKDIPNEKIHEDITRLFKQTFPLNQFHWWNSQVKEFFSVDFLKLDFNKSRGWQIYHFPKVSFLIIRQENFNQAPEALGQLFDMPSELIDIGRENAADDKKEISQLYQRAKDGLKFGSQQLDQLYRNPWFERFYTREEEIAFREIWQS
jgi:hypothetical protein